MWIAWRSSKVRLLLEAKKKKKWTRIEWTACVDRKMKPNVTRSPKEALNRLLSSCFFFFKRETILANPSKASFYRRSVFSNFHLAAFYVFLVIRLAQQNDSVWSCSNMGYLFVTTWSEPVREWWPRWRISFGFRFGSYWIFVSIWILKVNESYLHLNDTCLRMISPPQLFFKWSLGRGFSSYLTFS